MLGTRVSCAKTAELIEMPFGQLTRMGSRNRVLDGGQDAPMGRGNYGGCPRPSEKYWESLLQCMQYSVLNNSMTTDCNAPDWSVSQYIVPP